MAYRKVIDGLQDIRRLQHEFGGYDGLWYIEEDAPSMRFLTTRKAIAFLGPLEIRPRDRKGRYMVPGVVMKSIHQTLSRAVPAAPPAESRSGPRE